MDLRKEWQKLQEEKFIQSSIKKEDIMKAIYQESNSTIATLRKRLKGKMNWTLFFLVGFSIAMAVSYPNVDLMILYGIFVGAYLLGYLGMWNQYRQMNTDLDLSDSTLNLMKTNDQLVRQALNVEKIFGVCFFPVAIIGGLLLSKVMNGGTLLMAFQDARFLVTSLVGILVFVPIMWWLSNKMNRMAYGDLMSRLQNNIRRLEDLS